MPRLGTEAERGIGCALTLGWVIGVQDLGWEGAKEEGLGLLHPGPYLLKAGGETGASSIGRRCVINVQLGVISRAVTLSQNGQG